MDAIRGTANYPPLPESNFACESNQAQAKFVESLFGIAAYAKESLAAFFVFNQSLQYNRLFHLKLIFATHPNNLRCLKKNLLFPNINS